MITGLCCCSVSVCMVFTVLLLIHVVFCMCTALLLFMLGITSFGFYAHVQFWITFHHYVTSVIYTLWVTCLEVGGAALSKAGDAKKFWGRGCKS